MAGIRRKSRPAAGDVRGALAERLRVKARDFRDPVSGHLYRHPAHRLIDALERGRPVDVWPFLLRGIADVPTGARLVRVDVDGSVSAADYARVAAPDPLRFDYPL